MAGKTNSALTVGLQDLSINLGIMLLEPGEESRTKVEAEVGIIIDDIDDGLFWAEYPR